MGPPAARPVLAIRPLLVPPDLTVQVPGSKSITNRALVCAALARGRSLLSGALVADDTEAMARCLTQVGAGVHVDPSLSQIEVSGTGGQLAPGPNELDANQSGTTARFLLPVLALGPGPHRLDGDPSLRRRPMGALIDSCRALGIDVEEEGQPGHLPLVVNGGVGARAPYPLVIRGDVTSQFLSGLMLAGPCLPGGIRLAVTGPVVSEPYIHMTGAVMAAFGASAHRSGTVTGGLEVSIAQTGYRATDYAIEPDASSASYFLAAAAVTGGRVRVTGLGEASLQGDARFVDVLERMGARVGRGPGFVEVSGSGPLHGIDVELGHMPDMATTVAAVAVFAGSPTRVRGVGVIRGHETDRVEAMTNELRAAGIDVQEHADGWTVHPGMPRPVRFETYDDHRMAMSLSLLGLVADGIQITDPGCVAKTFPNYFELLGQLRR